MSAYEKADQPGLTIITRPPTAAKDGRAHVLSTIEDVDSTYAGTPCLTPTSTGVHGERDTPLLYHSSSNTPSLDAGRISESKQPTVYESDLESCMYKNDAVKIVKTCEDGKVWPGRGTLMQRYKRDKRKRQSCNPMKNLDKRTKVCIKLLIILIVVGGAVGLGIGISKAVGGGIWKSNSSTKPISR